MNRGTYFGHVVEHVTLELSHLIGREVYFGRTLWAGTPGWFRLILECPDEEWVEDPVAEQLLALALGAVTAVAEGRAPDLGPELARIADVYEESRLGVSAAGLARAARERDIPVRRLSDVAPAPARLRLPPPAGLGSEHRTDLGHRRGHRRRQADHQAAARRGRHPRARGNRRAQRRGGHGCLRLPRRAGRGQTRIRPPRAERLRRVHRRGGRHGLARRRGRRRAGPGRVIRRRDRLPRPGRRGPGCRRPALPGPGNRRRDLRYRCPGRPGQLRPPAGDRPRPAPHQDRSGRRSR